MKRFFYEFIWQWRGGSWITFNPIRIEFEYEKFESSWTFTLILMGLGIQVMWLCPWETVESKYAQECAKDIGNILSLGESFVDEKTLQEILTAKPDWQRNNEYNNQPIETLTDEGVASRK